jgi:hypothetical protein
MVTLHSHTSHALQPLEKQDVVGDLNKIKQWTIYMTKMKRRMKGGESRQKQLDDKLPIGWEKKDEKKGGKSR